MPPRRPRRVRRRSAGAGGPGRNDPRSRRGGGAGPRVGPGDARRSARTTASSPAAASKAVKSSRQNGISSMAAAQAGSALRCDQPGERDRPRPTRPGRRRCTAGAGRRRPAAVGGLGPGRRAPRAARRARRSMIAPNRIDEPRLPDAWRLASSSSAECRRQNPCSRSSPSRNPMSSTRSAMIASRVARSDRARTAQIGAATELDRRRQPDIDQVAGRAARPVAASPVTPAPARRRSRMDRPIGSPRRPTPRGSRPAPAAGGRSTLGPRDPAGRRRRARRG